MPDSAEFQKVSSGFLQAFIILVWSVQEITDLLE